MRIKDFNLCRAHCQTKGLTVLEPLIDFADHNPASVGLFVARKAELVDVDADNSITAINEVEKFFFLI